MTKTRAARCTEQGLSHRTLSFHRSYSSAHQDEGKGCVGDETGTETSNKGDFCIHHRHPGGKGDAAMLACGSHHWITCFKTLPAQKQGNQSRESQNSSS